MTTQKDNAMDAMQDFFPNGGREWDAIGALYDAIAAGKIPGVVTGEKVAELEQRLQQPIKLPNTTTNRHEWTTWQWIEHVGGRYQHGDPGDYIEFGSVMAVGAMLQQFQRTVIAVALAEIKNSLRLQGFKVEGE